MSAIEMASTRQGDILLQWYYEGKQIIRGISKEINIAELKSLIEKNARQTVKTTGP